MIFLLASTRTIPLSFMCWRRNCRPLTDILQPKTIFPSNQDQNTQHIVRIIFQRILDTINFLEKFNQEKMNRNANSRRNFTWDKRIASRGGGNPKVSPVAETSMINPFLKINGAQTYVCCSFWNGQMKSGIKIRKTTTPVTEFKSRIP